MITYILVYSHSINMRTVANINNAAFLIVQSNILMAELKQ